MVLDSVLIRRLSPAVHRGCVIEYVYLEHRCASPFVVHNIVMTIAAFDEQ